MLPKTRLLGFAVSWLEITPVPNTGSVIVDVLLDRKPPCPLPVLCELYTIETLPLTLLVDWASNVT
jgi:hypothetical protein